MNNVYIYRVGLDNEKLPILIKERSVCYGDGKCTTPDSIAELIHGAFNAGSEAEEHVWCISLDAGNNVKGLFEVSHGNVNVAVTNIRGIIQRVLLSGGVNFAVVHNHPSGCPDFSNEDINVAKNIKQAAGIMELNLLDFLAVGNTPDVYSSAFAMQII